MQVPCCHSCFLLSFIFPPAPALLLAIALRAALGPAQHTSLSSCVPALARRARCRAGRGALAATAPATFPLPHSTCTGTPRYRWAPRVGADGVTTYLAWCCCAVQCGATLAAAEVPGDRICHLATRHTPHTPPPPLPPVVLRQHPQTRSPCPQGLLEIGRTTFIIIILLMGAVWFIADTDRLVLQPLERMVALVGGVGWGCGGCPLGFCWPGLHSAWGEGQGRSKGWRLCMRESGSAAVRPLRKAALPTAPAGLPRNRAWCYAMFPPRPWLVHMPTQLPGATAAPGSPHLSLPRIGRSSLCR